MFTRFVEFKRSIIISSILCLLLINAATAQHIRDEIDLPDIPGYQTLKCDFHMHTVFSDGNVWPPIRVDEAWLEGLDAICITEHIEHQSHEKDIPAGDHNRSYELAKGRAEALDIILIQGAEITRKNPPGHFNAIFIKDAAKLDVDEWRDAMKAAIDQGAFLFWNHPGWRQPDKIPIWYDEHTEIMKNGWMHGMEIVNHHSHYPLAFDWCLDKEITILGNSDVHHLSGVSWNLSEGKHRPVTLVFAKERSAAGIREALDARRTAVYFENSLYGEEQYLKSLIDAAVQIKRPTLQAKGNSTVYLQIINTSDLSMKLITASKSIQVSHPTEFKLPAQRTTAIAIKPHKELKPGKYLIKLAYTVDNAQVKPDTGVRIEIPFTLIKE